MVDEHDQRAEPLGDRSDQPAEMECLLVRQPCSGLVEQHDAGSADDRARDLDEPALTRAEPGHLGPGEPVQPDRAVLAYYS